MRYNEGKGEKGLSIRKIAKKLRISKTVVVKYLKLFKQGYDPYQVKTQLIKKTPKKYFSFESKDNSSQQLELKKLEIEGLNKELCQCKEQLAIKNEELENTKQNEDQQIESLEEDKTNLKRENSRLKDDLIRKDEDFENLKQIVQDQDQEKNKLEEINKNLRIENDGLQNDLVIKDEEIQKLHDEEKKLKDANKILMEKNSSYKEQMKNSDEENKRLKQKINDDDQIRVLLLDYIIKMHYNIIFLRKIEEIEAIQNKKPDMKEAINFINREVPRLYKQKILTNKKNTI